MPLSKNPKAYCFLVLYHCPFEIGLCSAKERGHGRLGRVETGLLARTLPSGTMAPPNTHTGETRCAPFQKSKSMLLLGLLLREIPGVDAGRGHHEGAGIAHRREQAFFLAKFAEPVPLCFRK